MIQLPPWTRDLGEDALSQRTCSEFGLAGSSESDTSPESSPERPHTGMSIPGSKGPGLVAVMLLQGPGTISASWWAGVGTEPDPVCWMKLVLFRHPQIVSAAALEEPLLLKAYCPHSLLSQPRVGCSTFPRLGWGERSWHRVAHHIPAHLPHPN